MVISVTTHETVEYHSTTINGRTHTREEKTKIIVIEPMTNGGFKTGYRAPTVNEASSRGPASSDEVELAREVEMEDGSVRLVALLWLLTLSPMPAHQLMDESTVHDFGIKNDRASR
ncbi:hypothetical protein I316_03808 [Kwoniella heveanensis BCC8398]|uniref:Uncharacterized protein n=1 Tax=Kwoniella heveanensis BCC8398 TaxID=1296120 RepID=A0A1B9GT98_9TREE|nr:hypothetical protein I316_03808 [Kwoniella heveanensis BCC8398]